MNKIKEKYQHAFHGLNETSKPAVKVKGKGRIFRRQIPVLGRDNANLVTLKNRRNSIEVKTLAKSDDEIVR